MTHGNLQHEQQSIAILRLGPQISNWANLNKTLLNSTKDESE